MGSGGGVWETSDVITSARMNQKTVYVGGSAPGTTYDGMLWYDTTNKILKVRDNAGGAWISLSPQSGTATTSSGTANVAFGTAFPSTPRVFCMITDDTDAILKLSSVTTTGFTVTARVLTTATFVNSVTSPTGAGTSHTHSVTGTTGSESSHTHSVSTTTGSESSHTHSISYSTRSHMAYSTGTVTNYSISGHNVPEGFSWSDTNGVYAITSPTGAGSSHSHSVSATTGSGSSHSHSVSITSGSESSHTHTISSTTAPAVTGWANGGSVAFNWIAFPQ